MVNQLSHCSRALSWHPVSKGRSLKAKIQKRPRVHCWCKHMLTGKLLHQHSYNRWGRQQSVFISAPERNKRLAGTPQADKACLLKTEQPLTTCIGGSSRKQLGRMGWAYSAGAFWPRLGRSPVTISQSTYNASNVGWTRYESPRNNVFLH